MSKKILFGLVVIMTFFMGMGYAKVQTKPETKTIVMTDKEIANEYANMEHGDCKVILTDSDDEYIYYDVIEDGKVRWSSCTSRDYALQEIQR